MIALRDLPPPTPAGFVLAALAEGDAPDLLAHFGDPQVVEWLDIEPLTSLAEARETVAWAQARLAAGKGLRWSIRSEAGGAFVGTCGFNSLVLDRGRRGEIAYDLSRAWWGRGVMDAVLPLVIAFGFEALRLRRLEAMVTPGNRHSCALLERWGFACEGVLKDYGYWKGRYFDQLLYALTASGFAPTFAADQTAGRSLSPAQAGGGGKSGLHGDKAAGNARRG